MPTAAPRAVPVVRPATVDDVPALAALHALSWRRAYRAILDARFLESEVDAERRAVWTRRLATAPAPNQRVLVAEHLGALVGFACWYLDADPRWGTLLDNLHAHPDWYGTGLGRGLLQAAARASIAACPARPLHLWCYVANEPALRFYCRLGGARVGRKRATCGGTSAESVRIAWPDPRALV